jgi:hypothetical protein
MPFSNKITKLTLTVVSVWVIVALIPTLSNMFGHPIAKGSLGYVAPMLIIGAYALSLFWIFHELEKVKEDFFHVWLPVSLFAMLICGTAALYFWQCDMKLELPDDQTRGIDLLTCFYFAVVTFTTLGYGDITPVSGDARFLAASLALMGMIYGITFLAVILQAAERKR